MVDDSTDGADGLAGLRDALIRMICVLARQSRLFAISIPSARRDVHPSRPSVCVDRVEGGSR